MIPGRSCQRTANGDGFGSESMAVATGYGLRASVDQRA
jgi:hypothetical protein